GGPAVVRRPADPLDPGEDPARRLRGERDRAGLRGGNWGGGGGGTEAFRPRGGEARLPGRLVRVRNRGAEPAGPRRSEGPAVVVVLRAGLRAPRRDPEGPLADPGHARDGVRLLRRVARLRAEAPGQRQGGPQLCRGRPAGERVAARAVEAAGQGR